MELRSVHIEYKGFDPGSREAMLRQNLFTLRSLIQQYALDKKKAPQSLNNLVSAGYLKQVPKDPTTRKADWKPLLNAEHSGVEDVQSASPDIAWDGSRYNTW
jgi:general secretion pathway protein G